MKMDKKYIESNVGFNEMPDAAYASLRRLGMTAGIKGPLTEENYSYAFLRFQSRQAGISLVYSPERDNYCYHAYCMETQGLSELFSVEYEFLADALQTVNQEFATWEMVEHAAEKQGCGSCVAK